MSDALHSIDPFAATQSGGRHSRRTEYTLTFPAGEESAAIGSELLNDVHSNPDLAHALGIAEPRLMWPPLRWLAAELRKSNPDVPVVPLDPPLVGFGSQYGGVPHRVTQDDPRRPDAILFTVKLAANLDSMHQVGAALQICNKANLLNRFTTTCVVQIPEGFAIQCSSRLSVEAGCSVEQVLYFYRVSCGTTLRTLELVQRSLTPILGGAAGQGQQPA